MRRDLRILLTNDDGIDAAGLGVLRAIAGGISDDVWVVAPSGNQSGAGHRFTLGRELAIEQRAEREFAIAGTPADCVVAGCTHLLGGEPPDVVLSGVNHGQNLGDIIHCSGTLAGAREGALQGAIGIALSQGVDYEAEKELGWECATAHGLAIVKSLIANEGGRDVYYNVNFPFCAPEAVRGVVAVPHQRFLRSAFRYYQSRNEGHFFVSIPETPSPMDPGFDFHTLLETNRVCVTPLRLPQSDDDEIARLEGVLTI